jgi:hypothetical protein
MLDSQHFPGRPWRVLRGSANDFNHMPSASRLHWQGGSDGTIFMFKIERASNGSGTTLRLIGRIEADDIPELEKAIDNARGTETIDLDDVTLAGGDAVRFLGACEERGVELLHCPPYIREWIVRERDRGRNGK